MKKQMSICEMNFGFLQDGLEVNEVFLVIFIINALLILRCISRVTLRIDPKKRWRSTAGCPGRSRGMTVIWCRGMTGWRCPWDDKEGRRLFLILSLPCDGRDEREGDIINR